MADRRTQRAPDDLCVSEQLDRILTNLSTQDLLSQQSLPRVTAMAQRFDGFASSGLHRSKLDDVTADDVRQFVEASTAAGPVSTSTMHLRRSMLRLLFRTGRELGLLNSDPTLDLQLPRKSPLTTRPLDDGEIALCRSAALHTLTSTRLAAAWALSEATARTAELSALTIADLDLEQGRVWIHGGSRTIPRWSHMSLWGSTQLERHLRTLPTDRLDQRLVYRGDGSAQSAQASGCIVVADVLARAGLATEPDVRPLSVVAWAGRKILDETGRIDVVARRLGMQSLDRTATLIAFDWADEPS